MFGGCLSLSIFDAMNNTQKISTMKAQDLKVGSTLEIETFTTDENSKMVKSKTIVTIDRCSDTFVWFKYSGFCRIARVTIDKSPTYYKIVSI